jgi:hypothetical protein
LTANSVGARDADPRLAAKGARHNDHENPARAGSGGKADVRGAGSGNHQVGPDHHLHLLLNQRTQSDQERNRIAGVTWTNLAFVKTIEPS